MTAPKANGICLYICKLNIVGKL